jgi:hypothetical protein
MNRAALIVAALAVLRCGSGASPMESTVVDAGPRTDAGFYYTTQSGGTASFAGAVTGAWPAIASAQYETTPLLLPDGGSSGPYVLFILTGADNFTASGDQGNFEFGCTVFILNTTALQTGLLAPADVSFLYCGVILTDGGISEYWDNQGAFGLPNTFELNIISPGPETDLDQYGALFLDPTATLNVHLAPDPGPGEGVSFSVTVTPPACPPSCAPNL